LIEGVMAIQNIIDNEGIISSGDRGDGLGLVVQPTVQVQVDGQ